MTFNYQDALAYGGITGAHPGGFALTKMLFENEKIHLGAKMLDAGCGTGQTSSFLAKRGFKVIAIDNHPEMIKKATQRFEEGKVHVKVIEGNIENLPFRDGYFDWVVAESSTVFGNIEKSLKEYYRVLKSGGSLLCIEITKESPLSKTEDMEIKQFYGMKKIPTEVEWVEMIKESGFNTINILKAMSILEELLDYTFDEKDQIDLNELNNLHTEVELLLNIHSQMMMDYSEKLGYRVFKATKK
ncbi:MAG: class I SAM-dependent methyltransferase [Bacillaceae bacterium]|nr:class I SAM-dependent methyltransferase [Bacillaceae bacterium]